MAGRPTWTIRRPLFIGIVAILAMVGGLGIWAARAHIAGAVIGTGVIEVSSVRTAVQHPIGGVVVDILKRDGESVTAGDVILRLDDAELRFTSRARRWATSSSVGGLAAGRLIQPMSRSNSSITLRLEPRNQRRMI